MQIAIADQEGKVNLWCEHYGMDEDGFIHFNVINGAWRGRFKDNTVYVDYTKASFPGFLVWAGEANIRSDDEKYVYNSYNTAIQWIQDEINKPDYAMIPYEVISNYNPPKYNPEDYSDDGDDIPF